MIGPQSRQTRCRWSLVGRGVVRRRAVPEVGVGDQPELLEQLQRAVDGGDVDAAGVRCTAAQISSGVPCRARYRLQHELALRRQPVALRPQRGLQVGRRRCSVPCQARRSLAEMCGCSGWSTAAMS